MFTDYISLSQNEVHAETSRLMPNKLLYLHSSTVWDANMDPEAAGFCFQSCFYHCYLRFPFTVLWFKKKKKLLRNPVDAESW